jgi:hypothetical protein
MDLSFREEQSVVEGARTILDDRAANELLKPKASGTTSPAQREP